MNGKDHDIIKRASLFSGMVSFFSFFREKYIARLFILASPIVCTIYFTLFYIWQSNFNESYNYIMTPLVHYLLNNPDYLGIIIKCITAFLLIVGVVAYFFRIMSLKYENRKSTIKFIRDSIDGKYISPKNQGMSKHIDKEYFQQCAADFTKNSEEDFDFIKRVSDIYSYYMTMSHILFFIVIFFIIIWVAICYPLNSVALINESQKHSLIVTGILFIPLTIIIISLHGLIFPFQLALRVKYMNCMKNRIILEMYSNYVQALLSFSVQEMLKDAENKGLDDDFLNAPP